MNHAVSVIAFVVAAVAAFVDRPLFEKRPIGRLLSALIFLGIAAGLVFRLSGPDSRSATLGGLAAAAVTAIASHWLSRDSSPVRSVLLGTAGASLLLWIPTAQAAHAALAFAGGFGIAAWLLGCEFVGVSAIASSIALSMAAQTELPDAAIASTILLPAVAGIAALGTKSLSPLLSRLAIPAATAVIGYFVTIKWLNTPEAMPITVVGAVLGGLFGFLVPDEEVEAPFQTVLAAVISLGVATYAFSVLKGWGVALGTIAITLPILLTGNRRALSALGPIFGIVAYRVFREWYPDATRAIDIGQHYSMIGLLAGALLPVLLIAVADRADTRTQVGRLLTAIMVMLAPAALIVVIAAKGALGIIIGLGLAPIWTARDKKASGHVLTLSAALAAIELVAFAWLGPVLDMTRADKMPLFIKLVIGSAFVTVIIVALLAPAKNDTIQAEVA